MKTSSSQRKLVYLTLAMLVLYGSLTSAEITNGAAAAGNAAAGAAGNATGKAENATAGAANAT